MPPIAQRGSTVWHRIILEYLANFSESGFILIIINSQIIILCQASSGYDKAVLYITLLSLSASVPQIKFLLLQQLDNLFQHPQHILTDVADNNLIYSYYFSAAKFICLSLLSIKCYKSMHIQTVKAMFRRSNNTRLYTIFYLNFYLSSGLVHYIDLCNKFLEKKVSLQCILRRSLLSKALSSSSCGISHSSSVFSIIRTRCRTLHAPMSHRITRK